jgi:hypothetical protein
MNKTIISSILTSFTHSLPSLEVGRCLEWIKQSFTDLFDPYYHRRIPVVQLQNHHDQDHQPNHEVEAATISVIMTTRDSGPSIDVNDNDNNNNNDNGDINTSDHNNNNNSNSTDDNNSDDDDNDNNENSTPTLTQPSTSEPVTLETPEIPNPAITTDHSHIHIHSYHPHHHNRHQHEYTHQHHHLNDLDQSINGGDILAPPRYTGTGNRSHRGISCYELRRARLEFEVDVDVERF